MMNVLLWVWSYFLAKDTKLHHDICQIKVDNWQHYKKTKDKIATLVQIKGH
jgi:hypothetical protein